MTRKAQGSLELRNGTWSLRIRSSTVDPATGNPARRRTRVPLGSSSEIRSREAAGRAAAAYLARHFPERVSTGTTVQAAEYLERFITSEVVLYRASSRRHYTSVIRTHLVPAFGATLLSRVDAAAIKPLIASLTARGLHRATIVNVRSVLLQVLRQARLDGFDAQVIDPRLVRVPKQSIAEAEQRHISAQELQDILKATAPPWRALYAVMGLLGLRVAEALALEWRHLDLDGPLPLVRIRQSTSLGHILPLKTQTSRADLPLPDELVEILREHRAAWRQNSRGLLFASRNGNPLRAENVRVRQLQPLLERLGLKHAGFHAFRHGLPRRLFAAGCSPNVVQRLMRHASLAMTARYSHTTAEDLRAAVTAASQRTANNSLQTGPRVTQPDAHGPAIQGPHR